MTESSLVINYTGLTKPVDTFRLRLEQIIPLEGGTKYATLRKLARMWLLATTGTSPKLYRADDCPVEFEGDTIRIFLGFYVWPSDLTTPYSLRLAMGRIDELHGAQKIERLKEFSIFIDNQAEYELKYYLKDIESAIWETPTFDRHGAEIEPPTMDVSGGNTLKFSKEVFGCLRLRGWAVGFKHRIIMELSKPIDTDPDSEIFKSITDDHNISGIIPEYWNWNAPVIENLENIVTATWVSGEEERSVELRLETPECVEALLKMCPNFYDTIVEHCMIMKKGLVYYNACTGEILGFEIKENPHRFCRSFIDTYPGRD